MPVGASRESFSGMNRSNPENPVASGPRRGVRPRRRGTGEPSDRRGRLRRAVADALEPRVLFATFTVTTAADSGAGSLRQAITDANNTPNSGGADMIAFNIPGGGVHTIAPLTALPAITEDVIVDGYTQPGAAANTNAVNRGDNAKLMIELSGEQIPETTPPTFVDALNVQATVRIKGLVIDNWTGDGINLTNLSGVSTVAGCFI